MSVNIGIHGDAWLPAGGRSYSRLAQKPWEDIDRDVLSDGSTIQTYMTGIGITYIQSHLKEYII